MDSLCICDSPETLWWSGSAQLCARGTSRMLDWIARRSQCLAGWKPHHLQRRGELTAVGYFLKSELVWWRLLFLKGALSWNIYLGLHLPMVIYMLFLPYRQDKVSSLRSYYLKSVGTTCHLSGRWRPTSALVVDLWQNNYIVLGCSQFCSLYFFLAGVWINNIILCIFLVAFKWRSQRKACTCFFYALSGSCSRKLMSMRTVLLIHVAYTCGLWSQAA